MAHDRLKEAFIFVKAILEYMNNVRVRKLESLMYEKFVFRNLFWVIDI